MDSLRQSATFGSVVEPRRGSTILCKVQTTPKEGYSNWSAAGLIQHSLLNLGEKIIVEKYCHQICEMHQKLRQQQPARVIRKRNAFNAFIVSRTSYFYATDINKLVSRCQNFLKPAFLL